MTIKSNSLAYIAKEKVKLKPVKAAHNFKTTKKSVPFLWGDQVYVISTNSSTTKFSAKGHIFKEKTSLLMEEGILCWWQIDCGQGDAALLRFPNNKLMMVDAGPGELMSNSPALAVNYLKWMFFVDQSWRREFDFGGTDFKLDAVVCSHPDYDHFGGFLDLSDNIRDKGFKFGNVYHSGMGRYNAKPEAFTGGKGMSQLGPVAGSAAPDLFLTRLVDDFKDVRTLSKPAGGRNWKLSGTYFKWLNKLQTLEGSGVGKLIRVHAGQKTLPEFDAGAAKVNILGPIEEQHAGKPALRYFDGTSKSAMKSPSLTRNGTSVVMRIDYGDVRMLLTGDLNFRSQALLLNHIPSPEFKCHVAKACHHGSEDISTTFLQAMSPMATLFSSGDNETHAHPRAKVLGMAGAFTRPKGKGKNEYLGLVEEKYETPLIYSTELSRSVALFKPGKLTKDDTRITGTTLASVGASKRAGPTKDLKDWYLADSLIYGLINVRTDGKKVVIGVLKEGEGGGFQTESFTV